MQDNKQPDAFTVFVANMHASYVDEQLELGYSAGQILTLKEYTEKYHSWLIQQHKESTNG